MNKNKIVRSICYFTEEPTRLTIGKLDKLGDLLAKKRFDIQTKRICSTDTDKIFALDKKFAGKSYIFGIGTVDENQVNKLLQPLFESKDISFNLDLTNKQVRLTDVNILFNIISQKPSKTFNFAFVFNNKPSSPFFPSATYQREGFSIGLQPTDLSENCKSVGDWLKKVKQVWLEIYDLFKDRKDFLGIDSSIAPLFKGKSSLIGFLKRLEAQFSDTITTSIYLEVAKYIKENNPKPVGLCGLMFPCLEDFELADEYEKGNFSIERNIFLSLHCGLGIDTYPIGIDEDPKKVLGILTLLQGLSNKYKKPLSARFISDGKAKIGEKTNFDNQYLKDVIVRKL